MEIKDEFFRVEVISRTPCPQTTIWFALHQEVSAVYVLVDHIARSETTIESSRDAVAEAAIVRLCTGGRNGDRYSPVI